MDNALLIDEDLVRHLPLPLAQLYRRAHNAKTAVERHQAAYYLWEAALKLVGAVAVIEYAELGAHDSELAERQPSQHVESRIFPPNHPRCSCSFLDLPRRATGSTQVI